MPNKLNAKKYLKVSRKNKARNLIFKKKVKASIKAVKVAIESKQPVQEIEKAVKVAEKILDRAAQKKIIKKNASARKKGRLFKKLKNASEK